MTTLASLLSLAGPDLLIIILIFGILFAPFTIWMVVDCVNRETEGNSKIVWLLVILLAPFGSLIYLFGRKLQRSSVPPSNSGPTFQ